MLPLTKLVRSVSRGFRGRRWYLPGTGKEAGLSLSGFGKDRKL